MMFVIKPWKKSNNGWSIGVDAGVSLSTGVTLSSSMMELTDVSNENQMFRRRFIRTERLLTTNYIYRQYGNLSMRKLIFTL